MGMHYLDRMDGAIIQHLKFSYDIAGILIEDSLNETEVLIPANLVWLTMNAINAGHDRVKALAEE